MAPSNSFSLNNISTSKEFDFLNLFNNSFIHDNDINLQDCVNDSPYDNLDISCTYMDEYQCARQFKNCKKFTFMSLNIQSLPAKFVDFQDLITNFDYSNCAPDIICLQETWRIPDTSYFNINNYHSPIISQRGGNTQGGGVGFYFKNKLKFNLLKEKSVFIDRVFESVFAEVWTSNNSKIIVGSVYRPTTSHPNMSSSEQFAQFSEILSNLLNDFSVGNQQVVIFGDFNLDVLKYNIINQVTEYVDLLFSFGFLQLILRPTRCTPTSATLIDYILSNKSEGMHESVILTSKISDHFPIVYFSNINRASQGPIYCNYRDFSIDNINKFSANIRATNWNGLFNISNVQEAYDLFSDTFFTFYNLHFPLLKKKLNKNIHPINPWMTKGLLISRKRKIELCNLSLKDPNPLNILNFKNYRNL